MGEPFPKYSQARFVLQKCLHGFELLEQSLYLERDRFALELALFHSVNLEQLVRLLWADQSLQAKGLKG